MHQIQSSRDLINFSHEKSAGHQYGQCFLLDRSCRKMYTIFSAVLYCNRRKVTSFGLSARSAVYYNEAGSTLSMKFG
jgi:hypothetical protein